MESLEPVNKALTSPPRPMHTPPNSPALIPSSLTIPPSQVQAFVDILNRMTQVVSDSAHASEETSQPAKIKEEHLDEKNPRARASRLDFKTIDEIWDKAAYMYKIKDSSKSALSEENELDEYLFIVRRQFDKKNYEHKLYVDIKSESLRDALREILKDVNGITLREDKPTVEPNLLFSYLPELNAYRTSRKAITSQDKLDIQHLDRLLEYLGSQYFSVQKSLQPLLDHCEITYELLWALFRPNMLVYTTCPGSDQPRCLKFDWGREKTTPQGERYFELDCRYLDYDGKLFGEVSTNLAIAEFRGVKKINRLGVYPLQCHEEERGLKSKLVNRGKKFMSFMGVHHYDYEGFAFFIQKGRPVKVYVKSRIMIDASSFKQIQPNYDSPKINEASYRESDNSLLFSWDFAAQTANSSKNDSKVVKSNELLIHAEMSEEELLLCAPTVLGFSLGNKLWAEFSVSHISEIEWEASPFEHLVIPDDRKRVVRALAESHTTQNLKTPFDDFVKGKGRGLVVLLHGPPGVGKTLTAEGISDSLKRPLYAVCAGELGTDSKTLEDRLSCILHLARHWNAILLLDEADVFLEQRSLQNLQRNALVSVFLRQLEYFQGIMFLTTNRVTTFDEAFQSRIHFALKYDHLTQSAKKKIWTAFLQNSGAIGQSVNITSTDLDGLIRKDLNGRQIKNTVRTAHALATSCEEQLSLKHLEIAVNATEEFDRDFNGGHAENMRSYV